MSLNDSLCQLEGIWNLFQLEENADQKDNYLDMFLFEYRQLLENHQLNFNVGFRFLATVPSHLYTYFAENICRIVSESVSENNIEQNHVEEKEFKKCPEKINVASEDEEVVNGENGDQEEIVGNEQENGNELQFEDKNEDNIIEQEQDEKVTLPPRNEMQAVAALREYLTHHHGGRILDFFNSVNLHTISCQREFVNLLVKLFPTSKWDNSLNEALPSDITGNNSEILSELIATINILKLHRLIKSPHKKRKRMNTSADTLEALSKLPNFLADDSNQQLDSTNDSPCDLQQYEDDKDFTAFINKQFSCENIAVIILNLVHKCTTMENIANMDNHSVTIQSLIFAIEASKLVYKDIFELEWLPAIRQLIAIVFVNCFHKVYATKKSFKDVFDLNSGFQAIFEFLIELDVQKVRDQTCETDKELIFSLTYLIFVILNNCYVQNVDVNDGEFENIFKQVLLWQHVLTDFFTVMADHDENVNKVMMLLLKLVHRIKNVAAFNEVIRKSNRKQKKKPLARNIFNHHGGVPNFACALECILLNSLNTLNCSNRLIVLKFFQFNNVCCCNCTVDQIRLVAGVFAMERIRKNCLDVIKKMLSTVFSNTECNDCDSKKNSIQFESDLTELYKNWEQKLDDDERLFFFKHLTKMSTFLTHDLSWKILQEIVVPLFHLKCNEEVAKISDLSEASMINEVETINNISNLDATSYNDGIDTNKELILTCLNLFCQYLKDIRLIKDFYTTPMIHQMADMITSPDYASSICSLIKIALENVTFLGHNLNEQISITDQIVHIQIQAIDAITKVFGELFIEYATTMQLELRPMTGLNETDTDNPLLQAMVKNLRCQNVEVKTTALSSLVSPKTDDDIITDNQSAAPTNTSNQLAVDKSLHLGLIFWNTILQLLRTSSQFRGEYKAAFRQQQHNHNYVDVNLVINALTCVLYTKERATDNTNSLTRNGDGNHDDDVVINAISSVTNNWCVGNTGDFGDYNTYRIHNSRNDFWEDKCSGLTESFRPTQALLPDDDFQFDRDTNYFESSLHNDINDRGFYSLPGDFKFLFDINNQQRSLPKKVSNQFLKSNSSSWSDITASTHDIYVSPDPNGVILSPKRLILSGVRMLNSFVSHFLFGEGEQNEEKTANAKVGTMFSEKDLHYMLGRNCKNLMLQIFERSLGVVMMDWDSKMNVALFELKKLLLGNSIKYWNSVENSAIIIEALQSLLRVAEMKSRCCTVDNCCHMALRQKSEIGGSQMSVARSNDSEFLSVAQSLENSRFDSDIEPSEAADTCDDNYSTADEGYDADAEFPHLSETDVDESTLSRSSTAIRYRNHIVYEGICKIIVEILMDLSKRCLTDATFWPNHLVQVANRLAVIRDSIGGSLFILKGFSPVLQQNDIRLRDFQKSILELVTDINTPECLTAFCGILAADNPPVDILLPRFFFLANKTLQIHPSIEATFPAVGERNVTTTCDPFLLKEIRLIYDYHTYHQRRTPFTQSGYIAPLNYINFKPWTRKGFSVCMWLNVKGNECNVKKTASASASTTEVIDICEKDRWMQTKTHLISVGSNRLLLSVYIDGDDSNSMFLHLTRPSSDLTEKRAKKLTRSNSDLGASPRSARPKQSCACVTRKRQQNMGPVRPEASLSDKENMDDNADQALSAPGVLTSTCQAIKSTKDAIKNSFNQFNIFSSNGNNDSDECSKFNDSVKVYGVKLTCNTWTHLAFSVSPSGKEVIVNILIDGMERHQVIMLNPVTAQFSKNEKIHVLCIGDNRCEDATDPSSSDREVHQSTVFSLSSVMLFKQCIADKEAFINLIAMGPDCISLQPCQIGSLLPNYGLLKKVPWTNTYKKCELLNQLKDNVAAVWSAHRPNVIFGYSSEDQQTTAEMLGLMKFGDGPQISTVKSFSSALVLSGGLSSLLVLFARVVELTDSEYLQHIALTTLLKAAHSDNNLYTEFVKKDYMNLIGSVLKSSKCVKSPYLLKSILDTACDAPVLNRTSNDKFTTFTGTNACVLYPELIMAVLNNYSDWVNPNKSDECEILDILLTVLQSLVRDRHCRHKFNMISFQSVNIISSLINFCKINLAGTNPPIYISKESAKTLISLIDTFAGTPPPPSLLDEIVKLLMLLHRPSDSYITHDRMKFYFVQSLIVKEAKSKFLSMPFGLKTSRSAFRMESQAGNSGGEFDDLIHQENIRKSLSLSAINKDESKRHEASSSGVQDLVKGTRIKDINSLDTGKLRKAFTAMQTKQQFQKRSRIDKRKRKRLTSQSALEAETKRKRKSGGSQSDSEFVARDSEFFGDTDDERYHSEHLPMSSGLSSLQEGLTSLLRDFILILPDNVIHEVLSHYVTLPIILILANNKDANVRAVIVRLTAIVFERLSPVSLQNASKCLYWHHLGNQMSLYPANLALIEATSQWVTGSNLALDQILEKNTVLIIHKPAANVLMSILPQTVCSPIHGRGAVQLLSKLYGNNPNDRPYLIENGLIASVIKTLIKGYEANAVELIEAVHKLCFNLAYAAMVSTRSINVLWDTINGLSFAETRNIKNVKNIRSTQSYILVSLIKSYFDSGCCPSTSEMYTKFKSSHIVLSRCTLSNQEKRTRFDLLTDRSVQFLMNTDQPSTALSENEVKLIEILITLLIAGYQKGANLIAWGLCPARPINVKMFIISSLLRHSQAPSPPQLACDASTVKVLAQSFMLKDIELVPQDAKRTLVLYCNSLGPCHMNSWHLTQALEKISSLREHGIREQKAGINRSVCKYEAAAEACASSAMCITRDVVELQNVERRALINQMRERSDNNFSLKWKNIVVRMSHEGAPWHNPKNYPISWELDQTEGPGRIRMRLKRCVLNIKPEFILPDCQEVLEANKHPELLSYITSVENAKPNFTLCDQILFTINTIYVPLDREINGEILLTESQMIFLPNDEQNEPLRYDITSLTDVWQRRYQHQDIALEFFFDFNSSLFFVFESTEQRERLQRIFADKLVVCEAPKLALLIQQWREGQLSNWEYLMALNQFSGRTYQSLMQYPVFPWILSDYTSSSLDLMSPESYRKLEKPIAIQHDGSEAHYMKNFAHLMSTLDSSETQPYHYGSHYSNTGTVLHFLVRIPPFTSMFLQYQDNHFDIPDRTFHSIPTTWRLASKDSPTDVKEIIPEFFCLPEMFENNEGFNFGIKQSGEQVHFVKLPPWAHNSSRMFTLIHRQALESDYIRDHLHSWIDLIYGYKQTGVAAIDAINLFHPATYFGFNVNSNDPVEQIALRTMVKTYGQMPRQLMKSAHPVALPLPVKTNQEHQVLPSVKGIKWGIYAGSPQLSEPKICHVYQQFAMRFSKLIALCNTNVAYGIPEKCALMQGTEPDTMNLVQWGDLDGIIRITPLCEFEIMPKPLIQNARIDEITACGAHVNCNQLWFGHRSGRISVYVCYNSGGNKYNKSRYNQHANNKMSYNSTFWKKNHRRGSGDSQENLQEGTYQDFSTMGWKGPTQFVRHVDEVLGIELSPEFKIAVSFGRDGITTIWDLHRLQYVRSIQPPSICKSTVRLSAISPTLGDIVTVHSIEKQPPKDDHSVDCAELTEGNIEDFVNVSISLNGRCLMRLHTVNAKYVGHVSIEEDILSISYSYVKEGTGINVIATGFAGGIIRLWSSWDLSLVKEIFVGKFDIISIAYSTYQHMMVLTKDNVIQVWDANGLGGNPPKLPQIVFQKPMNV